MDDINRPTQTLKHYVNNEQYNNKKQNKNLYLNCVHAFARVIHTKVDGLNIQSLGFRPK